MIKIWVSVFVGAISKVSDCMGLYLLKLGRVEGQKAGV